jgi:predicted transcriptional regulator YdeE
MRQNLMSTIDENAFDMMGTSVRTTNEDSQAQTDIPALWERFFEEGVYEKIADKEDQTIRVLYTDYESDEHKPYTCVIGAKISKKEGDVPAGLELHHVPASKYEVCTAKGKMPDVLIEAWHKIWSLDLKRTYTGDYEVYDPALQKKNEAEVSIYIAGEV